MSDDGIDLGDLSGLVDGSLRRIDGIGEHGIVVCRVAGRLCAFSDNCSHRDARLSEGRLRGSSIVCPVHGARFDVVTGEHKGPPATTPIEVHRVEERDGRAFLVGGG